MNAGEQEREEEIQKKVKKAHRIFRFYLICYIVLLAISIYGCRIKYYVSDGTHVWIYFAWVLGSMYVFITFYYFYEHYLLPYVKDLEKGEPLKRNVYSWMIVWILPAFAVQYFIFIGFWLTVQVVPFKQFMYSHPYMYGQIYKKVDNYLSPTVQAAGFQKKLEGINSAAEKKNLEEQAKFLENEFSVHIKNFNHPSLREGPAYLDAIHGLISKIYQIPFFIALTFSFLGGLIYSLNDTVYRFLITDLYPKTFVGYLVRFIFAPALSLVIAYYLMNDWWINIAPILFFLVGFFPQVALRFVEQRARTLLKLKKKEKQEIPLELLQGMTDYIVYRFQELGIGDAQNLAYSDLNYLRKNWYNDRQLCDFVAQALLLIHLKDHFQNLQNAGIRNIISYKNVITDQSLSQDFLKDIGVSKEKLEVVMKLIKSKPLLDRIQAIEKIMNDFDIKEIDNLEKA